VPGAVLVTGAVLAGVYGVTSAGQAGWAAGRTIAALAAAAVLAAAFTAVESRAAAPLVPLMLLRVRNLLTASVTGVLWTAGMFAMFFLTTLYLQLVLGYSPLQTGLAFLPTNLLMAGVSMGVSARLVARFGIKPPLAGGLLLAAAGLALMARAPVGGHFATDLLPGMIALGFGAGTALPPLLLTATGAVAPRDAGLASGISNTSIMLGGALGLAVLAGVAATRTRHLAAAGHSQLAALTGGYHLAYLVAAACTAAAALIAAAWLRTAQSPSASSASPAAQPAPSTAAAGN
ncbi:MAG: MFS transporter, partial [Actinobacteria bacterium]|nr:MFS transporter [Actinomycetota bacterium]